MGRFNVCHTWLIEHKSFNKARCLMWPFAKFKDGYGAINRKGEIGSPITAHRAMCIIVYGNPPEGKELALHKCNNKLCVNPRHLYWGNHSDNNKDAYKAGNR